MQPSITAFLRYSLLALLTSLLLVSPQPSTASPDELHPRLFFSTQDISKLQAEAAATHADIWAVIQQFVDSQLKTAPPASLPAKTDVTTFRNYADQLIPYAFVCALGDDQPACDLTKRYLLTYSTWKQWDETNRRDLGLAHMLIANSLAYDWIYPHLSPDERLIIRSSIARWAQRMYEASAEPYNDAWTNWWAASYVQNHHWTNNSALGIAALVLLPEATQYSGDCAVSSSRSVNMRQQPMVSAPVVAMLSPSQSVAVNSALVAEDGSHWWETAAGAWIRADVVTASGSCDQLPLPPEMNPQTWLDQAVKEIGYVRALLDGVGDGSWHEGIQYQNYGLTMMLPFLYNLRRLEGIDLYPSKYLANYPAWRIYNNMPGTIDSILSYADFETWWGNSYDAQNILRFIASEDHDGQAEWMAQQLINVDGRGVSGTPWEVFEFLYYDPTIAPEPPTNLPLSRVFPDGDELIWRTGWSQNDLIFALKTGAFGGRFGFDTFTKAIFPWAAPCTGCTFNVGHDHADANTFYLARGGQWLAPETNGDGKTDTSFHNTILVDGQGQLIPAVSDYPDSGKFVGTDGALKTEVDTVNFDFAISDATQRYQNIGDMQDFTRDVLFVKPGYLLMFDHLAAASAHQYQWISHFAGKVSTEKNWIRGNTDGDQILGVNVIAPQPFQTTIGNDGSPFVSIQSSSAQQEMRFINLLYPTDAAHWDTKPSIEPLPSTDEDNVIRVKQSDGSYDDVLFSFVLPTKFHSSGNYAYDGRVTVLRYKADGTLADLFVYGGTFVTDQSKGITFVSDLNGTQPFEAQYNGNTVAVSGKIISVVTLRAPGIRSFTVNGEETPFAIDGDNITFGSNAPPS